MRGVEAEVVAALSGAKAIASRSLTLPVSVVKLVSITSVPGRYRRSLLYAPTGRIDQWPASGSRRREKTASLS